MRNRAFTSGLVAASWLLAFGLAAAQTESSRPATAHTMDHGEMQGGRPPADARDSNAYSDGLKRGEGIHALPGVPRLKLGDEMPAWGIRVPTLEATRARGGGSGQHFSTRAHWGSAYNKLVLKAEGDVESGRLHDGGVEVLWGRALTAFWDAQLGARFDRLPGTDRQWLALGVHGLAPYWFEVDATAYVGNDGRTALRLEADYDVLFTQRLILKPKISATAFGRSDRENGIGSGLSNVTAGMRLRYEISRQFAPYVGVERVMRLGETADISRAAGHGSGLTRWVAGVQLWY